MNPYEILSEMFKSSGFFAADDISVHFKNEKINAKIIKDENNNFKLSFPDSKPLVKIKKMLTLTFSLSAITLKEDGGIFHIDFWPDVPFKYNWLFTQEM